MKINNDVLHHEINGEMVLLHVSTGNYYSLNEIGAEVWSGLSEGFNMETIIQNIGEMYEADYETIKKDVEDICTKLADEGLISP